MNRIKLRALTKENEKPPVMSENDGWKITLDNDFSTYSSIDDMYSKTPWRVASHGRRAYEYWCDQMVSLDDKDGALVIMARKEDDHECDVCKAKSGHFTSCLETPKTQDNEGFNQAYGYYEAVCKVPDSPGLWAAFWLQCTGTNRIGYAGRDGAEIDVFESSFHEENRTCTGNAVHYDSYFEPFHKCISHIKDVGYDLYDGKYHKYAMHWTPEFYAFYVDDKLVWLTDAHGVSTVPSYLRLSIEIRDTKYGPYKQILGTFENKTDGSTDFCIKSVKVWQKDEYVPFIRDDSFYTKRSPYAKWASNYIKASQNKNKKRQMSQTK